MAVAVTVDVPGGTEQQRQQITGKIFCDGKLPEAASAGHAMSQPAGPEVMIYH